MQDNCSEFKNARVDELCDDLGIKYEFLAKYTPQSSGLVERKIMSLIDMVRLMLIDSICHCILKKTLMSR
jgi:transposase InsO family protein